MAADDPSLDEAWRWLTDCGHAAFERQDFEGARQAHAGALAEADQLFGLADNRPPAALLAPMTYTIAACNLAAVHQAQGAPEAAGRVLWRPVERLLRTAECMAPAQPLAIHCLRHWPKAVTQARLMHADTAFEADLAPLLKRFQVRRNALVRYASQTGAPGPQSGADEPLH